MTHIDLFSGIGGFALAARWNGIKTVQFVEKDERCREFLSRAWPGVPIHDDIRTFHWSMAHCQEIGRQSGAAAPSSRRQEGWTDQGDPDAGGPVFLLTGGVPCQPASRAGKQRGAEDDRWLWPDAVRVLGEVKPAWAIYENPPGIGDVGLSGILSQVEDQGYEVRVFSVPACAVGSPQIRERYWIVAHNCKAGREEPERAGAFRQPRASAHGTVAERLESDVDNMHFGWRREDEAICSRGTSPAVPTEINMADRDERGSENGRIMPEDVPGCGGEWEPGPDDVSEIARARLGGLADSGQKHGERRQNDDRVQGWEATNKSQFRGAWGRSVWLPCADGKVRRAPDDSFGLVDGLHRSLLGALGNSIVPHVAAEIMRAIMMTDRNDGKITEVGR